MQDSPEKFFVSAAPAVCPEAGAGVSVAAASAKADRAVLTSGAFRREHERFRDKTFCRFGGIELAESVREDVSEKEAVERVEIAGIDAAVAFDRQSDGAAAVHAAGRDRLSGEAAQKVVEEADADVYSVQPVMAVAGEDGAEKVEIPFRGQVELARAIVER